MPDRRAWKRVSDIILGQSLKREIDPSIIAGIVGLRASGEFFESLHKKSILSGKDILFGFEHPDIRAKLRKCQLHEISIINDSIFAYLETERIPDEDVKKAGENILSYFSFLSGFKKECAAHFTSCYQNPAYKNAIKCIARLCPLLPGIIIQYINKIQ